MSRLARYPLVVFLFVALVGVGVASGPAGAAAKPSPTKIKVDARNFAFSPKKLKVKAGQKVTIVLHSTDSQHDFTLEDGDTVVDVAGDKTKSGSFKLAKPGKYDFYCSIPGHRQAGMEGTITAS
jgi:plastocyanin